VLPLLFLVWWPRPFIDSVVLLQLREPFRPDSLSFLGLLYRNGWGEPSAAWTAAALIAALAIVLPRTERTPAGVAASLAIVLMTTFAFGRKAFCNYYFFVIGALCCAVAASGAEPAIMANKRRIDNEPAVRSGP
jgi:hypothetical protein